jgi:hypothetical protein
VPGLPSFVEGKTFERHGWYRKIANLQLRSRPVGVTFETESITRVRIDAFEQPDEA